MNYIAGLLLGAVTTNLYWLAYHYAGRVPLGAFIIPAVVLSILAFAYTYSYDSVAMIAEDFR